MSLAYEIPYWDEHQWHKFVELTPQAEDAIATGQSKIFSFDQFSTEVFSRLYSWDVEPLPKPKPEAAWAIKLHEELTQNQQFQDLQDLVGGNYHLAGLAATSFLAELAQCLPTPQKPIQDPQELRLQVLGQKRRGSSADQELIAQLIEQGKQAVQDTKDYANSLAEDALTAVSAAAESATEQVQQFLCQMEGFGWGLGDGVDGVGGSIEEKARLAEKINQSRKLKQIAKQAGRLKRVAAAKQRSKTKEARHSIESIEAGNDLARLLPSQVLAFKVPELKPLFVKGYAEKSLLQYKLGGKDRMGRGPIVACLDSSGSMGGDREIWSKAVCLALLGIAFEQKRHFRLIHFSNAVCRTDDFPAEQNDAKTRDRLLRSMEFFSGGGTDWEQPLDKAVECITSDKNMLYADVVLITDGECDVSDKWLARFKQSQKQHDFTCFGIMIGSSDCPRSLKSVTDQAVCIGNLNDDKAIAEVFSI